MVVVLDDPKCNTIVTVTLLHFAPCFVVWVWSYCIF